MKSSRRLLTLSLTILHTLSLMTSAAVPTELVVLQTQYEHAVVQRVTAVHEAAVAALNARFTTALDTAITQAKNAGDLAAVLAMQEDKRVLAGQQPLPPDDEKTPEALKKLRAIYREQLARLAEQRNVNATALLTPYTARLKELEAALTKADRIPEAQEVLVYREGLKADAQPAAAAAQAEPSARTAGSAMSAAVAAPKVKGDDRKAAEWVLSVGGFVDVWVTQTDFRKITSSADLPKGRLSLRGVTLDNNSGNIKPVADADLAVLAGLERLQSVVFNTLSFTPAAYSVLGTCPELYAVAFQYNKLGDELWQHLAGIKQLKQVSQGYDSAQGAGISKLNSQFLDTLFLGNAPISNAALVEIASFPQLTRLILESSQITDAGMPALAPLKKLTGFNARNTDVTAAGLAAIKGAPITSLGYGRNMEDVTSQLPQVAELFPKLTRLNIPREVNPVAADWAAIAKALPGLKVLLITSHKFTDDGCAGLEALPELEELDLTYCTVTDEGISRLAGLKTLRWLSVKDAKITDAALQTLAGMKKLKTLALPKPGNGLTAEGIAKLRRQRPDMEVR